MIDIFTFFSSIVVLLLRLTFFFLPAGVANMSPVFFQHRLNRLAVPVDFGWTLVGEPLFGNHKTWRGLITATLCGGLFFVIQRFALERIEMLRTLSPFDLSALPWWFGFCFAAGAILGDLIKSFFKRRIRIPPGEVWFPFDQVDFVLGAALVASFFLEITPVMWVLLFSFGTIAHIVGNHVGYWLGIKHSPW